MCKCDHQPRQYPDKSVMRETWWLPRIPISRGAKTRRTSTRGWWKRIFSFWRRFSCIVAFILNAMKPCFQWNGLWYFYKRGDLGKSQQRKAKSPSFKLRCFNAYTNFIITKFCFFIFVWNIFVFLFTFSFTENSILDLNLLSLWNLLGIYFHTEFLEKKATSFESARCRWIGSTRAAPRD